MKLMNLNKICLDELTVEITSYFSDWPIIVDWIVHEWAAL